jgi:hypothetical protein
MKQASWRREGRDLLNEVYPSPSSGKGGIPCIVVEPEGQSVAAQNANCIRANTVAVIYLGWRSTRLERDESEAVYHDDKNNIRLICCLSGAQG